MWSIICSFVFLSISGLVWTFSIRPSDAIFDVSLVFLHYFYCVLKLLDSSLEISIFLFKFTGIFFYKFVQSFSIIFCLIQKRSSLFFAFILEILLRHCEEILYKLSLEIDYLLIVANYCFCSMNLALFFFLLLLVWAVLIF